MWLLDLATFAARLWIDDRSPEAYLLSLSDGENVKSRCVDGLEGNRVARTLTGSRCQEVISPPLFAPFTTETTRFPKITLPSYLQAAVKAKRGNCAKSGP